LRLPCGSATSSKRFFVSVVEHCAPTASGSNALSTNSKRAVQRYMSFEVD